jgi:hypothetical protein
MGLRRWTGHLYVGTQRIIGRVFFGESTNRGTRSQRCGARTVEASPLFPTVPQGGRIQTVAFDDGDAAAEVM